MGYIFFRKNTQVYQRFTKLCVIISLILYFATPNVMYKPYINLIGLLYLIQLWIYFRVKEKNSYLEFDTIFLLIFSIASLAYPLLIYDPDMPFVPFFGLSFNTNNIPKALSGSCLALSAYIYGNTKRTKTATPVKFQNKQIRTTYIVYIILALSIAFFGFGGLRYLNALYVLGDANLEDFGMIFQIESLLTSFIIAFISIEFYNYNINKNYNFNKLAILAIMTISAIIILAGNRSLPMRFMLPLAFYFSLFFYRLSKFKFLVSITLAVIFMALIGYIRDGTALTDLENLNAEKFIRDIVIPARSNYLVYEVVDKFGYTYGTNLSLGIFRIIPSFTRLLTILGIDSSRWGSAEFFTDYSQQDVEYNLPGLGTMLQADAFMSFGIIGVILTFYLIGYYSNKLYESICEGKSIYAFVIYSCFMADSVFWIRGMVTLPLKNIVWCCIIVWFAKNKRIKI